MAKDKKGEKKTDDKAKGQGKLSRDEFGGRALQAAC